jgi:hypothetical protein
LVVRRYNKQALETPVSETPTYNAYIVNSYTYIDIADFMPLHRVSRRYPFFITNNNVVIILLKFNILINERFKKEKSDKP